MIRIINQQKKLWVSKRLIKHQLCQIQRATGFLGWDLGLYLVDNQAIQTLNCKYRKKDKPTDVLSFPFHEQSLTTKLKPELFTDQEYMNLGEIVLSLEYANEAAKNKNDILIDWINTLLVHSFCHLLGYDHETDSDFLI
ncbi:hypothetical protein BB561_006988, partial [Smittium simulii]